MRLTVLFFCLILMILGGCGIKPSKLDPPPGVKKDSFPKTYPKPDESPSP